MKLTTRSTSELLVIYREVFNALVRSNPAGDARQYLPCFTGKRSGGNAESPASVVDAASAPRSLQMLARPCAGPPKPEEGVRREIYF